METLTMNPQKSRALSSRTLLNSIGLGGDGPAMVNLDDELLESPVDGLAQALQERFQSITTHHSFQPGDLVCWKPGLRNRHFPQYGVPAVVLEVLDVPVRDSEQESGCTYFREPLDIVLGVFLDEGEHRGDFLAWHFDSRRFQPWQRGDM